MSSHCEKHLAKSGSGHKVSGPITNLEDDIRGWVWGGGGGGGGGGFCSWIHRQLLLWAVDSACAWSGICVGYWAHLYAHYCPSSALAVNLWNDIYTDSSCSCTHDAAIVCITAGLSLTSCSRSEIQLPAGVTVQRRLRTNVGFMVSGCDHGDALTALPALTSPSDNRAAVAQEVIRRSPVRFFSSPGCTSECPWARYWSPNCSWWAGRHLAWQPLLSLCECVCEWVNVISVVKCFKWSAD